MKQSVAEQGDVEAASAIRLGWKARQLRRIIENRLLAALKSNKVDNIKRWLAVANGGAFDDTCWAYEFASKHSLPEKTLELSDACFHRYYNPSWYHTKRMQRRQGHHAQTYVLSATQCWQETKKIAPVPLKWQQRFIRFAFGSTNLMALFSKNDAFKDETMRVVLKEHLEKETELKTTQFKTIMNALKNTLTDDTLVEETKTLLQEDKSLTPMQKRAMKVFLVAFKLNKKIRGLKKAKTPVDDTPPESIRNKFTVPQTIDHTFTTKTTQFDSLPSTQKGSTTTTSHWLGKLTLNHQIDQNHLHHQAVEQQKQVNVSLDLDNNVDIGSNVFIDDSEQFGFKTAYNGLESKLSDELKKHKRKLKNSDSSLFTTQLWLRELKWSLRDEKISSFHVSLNALEILRKGAGNVKNEHGIRVYLDALPLGFFLDKKDLPNVLPQCTLKFSKEYRKFQLATLPDAKLRLDPYNSGAAATISIIANQKKWDTAFSQHCLNDSLDSLLGNIKQKKITLSRSQKDFLQQYQTNFKTIYPQKYAGELQSITPTDDRVASEPYNEYFRPFRTLMSSLHLIATQSTEKDFCQFLDIVIKFYHRNFTNTFFPEGHHNLLAVFISYLTNLPDGSEFNHPEHIHALKRLLELSDEELSWFDLVTNNHGDDVEVLSVTRDHINFLETTRALFYFIDFFKSKGYTLPTKINEVGPIFRNTAIYRLKAILDCINLSSDPTLQIKLMAKIPVNEINQATTLLRAGFCVVHEDMRLYNAVDSSYAKSAYFVSRDWLVDLKSLISSIGADSYKSYFLCYLAYNCNGEAFEQGLQKWESLIIGTDEKAQFEQLKSHWDELTAFTLSFPTKLDNTSQKIPTRECFVNEKAKNAPLSKFQYALDDLNSLPIPSKDAEYCQHVTTRLNALAFQYKNMSPKRLTFLAKNAKQSLIKAKGKNKQEKLIRCLALLREIHYRHSGHKEWLRLEQVITILLSLRSDRLLQVDTSEGKTLIIQFVALIRALQGKKVDVITHNEILANNSCDEIQGLCSLLNLTACKKTFAPKEVLAADILFIDIAAAVINNKIATILDANPNKTKNTELMGNRKAHTALIDEIDNVVIDVHANTTMQFSDGGLEADDDLVLFLQDLNQAVVDMIAQMETNRLPTKEAQREFVRKQVVSSPYYQANCIQDNVLLDFWIGAAYTRAHPELGLKINTDYVLEPELATQGVRKIVRIVHKDTTGRVDKISQWGSGVHQCVAAWENSKKEQEIVIPGLSCVIAEGDVAHYLQNNYESRCGYTATIGDKDVQALIERVIRAKSANTVVMPRAKRAAPEGAAWPIVNGKAHYSRSYHFTCALLPDRKSHYQALFEALDNARDQDYSSIVFFNTIAECEQFSRFLVDNNLKKIQILDDTNPQQQAETHFHPSEATVIERANEPGMVTLTTAAGSRGTNFHGITLGIEAMPSLSRVTGQKAGRTGRNLDLGVNLELYCALDLNVNLEQPPEPAEPVATPEPANAKAHFRLFIEPWEKRKQAVDLTRIQTREPLRNYKEQVQEQFHAIRKKSRPKTRKPLMKAWAGFFNQIDLHWVEGAKTNINLKKMEQLRSQKFAKTAWKK